MRRCVDVCRKALVERRRHCHHFNICACKIYFHTHKKTVKEHTIELSTEKKKMNISVEMVFRSCRMTSKHFHLMRSNKEIWIEKYGKSEQRNVHVWKGSTKTTTMKSKKLNMGAVKGTDVHAAIINRCFFLFSCHLIRFIRSTSPLLFFTFDEKTSKNTIKSFSKWTNVQQSNSKRPTAREGKRAEETEKTHSKNV